MSTFDRENVRDHKIAVLRAEVERLRAEIERLKAELKGALDELYAANQARHRAYLATLNGTAEG